MDEKKSFSKFSLKELISYRNILAMSFRMITSAIDRNKNERHWELVNSELEDRLSLTGDFLWSKSSHLGLKNGNEVIAT